MSRFPKSQHFEKILNTRKPPAPPLPQQPIAQKYFNYDIKNLNIEDEIVEYFKFNVEESGRYNVFSQLCVHCLSDTQLNSVQFGICKSDYSDNGKNFKSNIVNTMLESGNIIVDSLNTLYEMDKGSDYILWIAMNSSDKTFAIEGNHSNLQLIKM